MDIYDRITELLAERGWSRRQLAERSGVANGTLATAFMRRSDIGVGAVAAVADALRVSIDYLVTGDKGYRLLKDPSVADLLSLMEPMTYSRRAEVTAAVKMYLMMDAGKHPMAATGT